MNNRKKETICTDIRRFAEVVCKAVSEELGGDSQVKLQEVIKNNGVVLQGLIILNGRSNLSPTIYLNPFLEAYENDIPLADIVARILDIYNRDLPTESVNMNFFRDFEKVKDRICYRVISRERNRSLLERIPHIDFLDLSICFFYSYEDVTLGDGSILIYNNHMDIWRCNVEKLLDCAKVNTPRIYVKDIINMGELLEELSSGMQEAVELPMYVMSNKQRTFGAATILYPDALGAIGKMFKENFYILPSSIHEIILLPEHAASPVDIMRDMVKDINFTQVAPEEVLSDNVYFYDRLANHVRICKF
ncbi:MAG: hypothetical protein E7292_02565 [Lachnospiraceae bacterium]|nr:hypothetical protein [Lachnospiraceae bacterium]